MIDIDEKVIKPIKSQNVDNKNSQLSSIQSYLDRATFITRHNISKNNQVESIKVKFWKKNNSLTLTTIIFFRRTYSACIACKSYKSNKIILCHLPLRDDTLRLNTRRMPLNWCNLSDGLTKSGQLCCLMIQSDIRLHFHQLLFWQGWWCKWIEK